MPIHLRDLTAQTTRTTAEYDGQPFEIEVRHQLITGKFISDLWALDDLADNAPEKLRALAEQTVRVVAWWDMLDADEAMFPLDIERVRAELPIRFLNTVLVAAVGVMRPGELTAAAGKSSRKK